MIAGPPNVMVVGDKDGRYCGSINALDREYDDNLNSKGLCNASSCLTLRLPTTIPPTKRIIPNNNNNNNNKSTYTPRTGA